MNGRKAIVFGYSLFFGIWTLVGAVDSQPILWLLGTTVASSVLLTIGLAMGGKK